MLIFEHETTCVVCCCVCIAVVVVVFADAITSMRSCVHSFIQFARFFFRPIVCPRSILNCQLNRNAILCVYFLSRIGLVADLKSQLPDIDKHFHIHHRIGEGTFSTVFMTSLRCHKDVPPNRRRFFALKYLVPTSHPKRIAQELRCLKEIG